MIKKKNNIVFPIKNRIIDITNQVINNKTNRHLAAGIILVLIGVFFMLQQLFPAFSHFMRWRFLLPLLLIAFGINLLIKKSK